MFKENMQHKVDSDNLICPLDYRYGRKEMKNIFSYSSRITYILKVESFLIKTLSDYGILSEDLAKEVIKNATLKKISINRISELEEQVKHDLMSVVLALTEVCDKDSKKYIHLGVTSYDIIDTAIALQLKDALIYIKRDIIKILNTLSKKIEEYKSIPMIGRTHGQHAIPITIGLKFSVWGAEFFRHYHRLKEMEKRILVGKISGATGTGAALKLLGIDTIEFEQNLLKNLNLNPEEGATQIVQRDRHVELINFIAGLSVTIEKIATEIRTLQRTEIGEFFENFDIEHQVGSSTMAHKRNPIMLENITGLSRIIRGFVNPTFENAIQWNERDLSNSSGERFIIPHTLIILDDILVKLDNIFKNLKISKDNCIKNIYMTKGAIMAESLMISLVKKGFGRQEAHEIVRKLSLEAQEKDIHLIEIILKSDIIKSNFKIKELIKILEPLEYIGDSIKRCDIVVNKIKEEINVE